MTRRIIALPLAEGKYLVSQEFNGDRNEFRKRGGSATSVRINWPTAVARFEGVCSEQEFRAALRDVEAWYGYEQMEPEMVDTIPSTEEVWAVRAKHLTLVSRYSEPVENMADDPEYYQVSDDIQASLHKMQDGRVYMMMDGSSYMPIPWANGRHNYTNEAFQVDVGQTTEFMPMFGNNNPVYTAMMRIK